VKVAYINFLNHCYIDTEVEMKEIYTSSHIWHLFESFLIDMAMVFVDLLLYTFCVLLVSMFFVDMILSHDTCMHVCRCLRTQ